MKVKLLYPHSLAPSRGSAGAAGYDLYAACDAVVASGGERTVPTGVAIEIPPGYVGLVRSRSGLRFEHSVETFHGTIDSDYRGEIVAKMVNYSDTAFNIKRDDRIAQLIVVPYLDTSVDVVTELSCTKRGEQGFGSTG